MANAYVREYSGIPKGDIQLSNEPANQIQTVSYTSSTQSTAFHSSTNYVMIYAPDACYVEFGASPSAVAASIPLEAGKIYYFGVNNGDKVAIYDGSS